MITLTSRRIGAGPGSPRLARLALDAALVYLLFWAAHAVYRGSAGYVQYCDGAYSLAVSEKLLTHRTLDLRDGYPPGSELPYQLTRHADPRRPADPPGVYYGYPLGSSLLSLPFVQVSGLNRGLSVFHPDGRPHTAVEEILQLRIAARVSAAVVVLFYLLARCFCPPVASMLIAVGFAFGSPVWSTLSRGLWSHTWMVFCLSVAVLLLAADRRYERPSAKMTLLVGAALGTALFWTVFVRAQGVFSVAAVGVYLLLHHRRLLLVTLATGGLWSAALVAASLHHFGTPTPPSVYDPGTIDGRDVLNRFAWLMGSPSRGLLVYCPYLLVVAAVLLGWRRHLAGAGLLFPAGLAVAGHTALFACYSGWHGGSSYGPRYFADLLPWFVLATAVAVRALRQASAAGFAWRKGVAVAALVGGFAWGTFVHYRGANAVEAWLWNTRSLAVGQDESVREWRHPQFLAGLTFDVNRDGSVTAR